MKRNMILSLLEAIRKNKYSCLMLQCDFLKPLVSSIHDIIDKNDLHEYGLEADPHVTVLYGIHTSDSSHVASSLNLGPVSFELGPLSLFENDEFDVLKFSIVSDDLCSLNKQCKDQLEFTSTHPEYNPHLTVAYLVKGAGKKYLSLSEGGGLFTSSTYTFSDADSNKTTFNA